MPGLGHRPDQPDRGGVAGEMRRKEDRRHQPEHRRRQPARARQRRDGRQGHRRGRRRRSCGGSPGRLEQEALDGGGGVLGVGQDEQMTAVDQLEPGVGQPARRGCGR